MNREVQYDVLAVLPPDEQRERLRRLDQLHPIAGYEAEVVTIADLRDDLPWWSDRLAAEFVAYLNFALLHGAAVLTLRSVPETDLASLAGACDAALKPAEAPMDVPYLPLRERPMALAMPSGAYGDGHLDTPRDTAFSADGGHAVTTAAGLVKIWDVASGLCVATVPIDAMRVRLSPDGAFVLAIQWQHSDVLETATGRRVTSVPSEDARFSPDSRRLAVVDHRADTWTPDGEIEHVGDVLRVYDTTTGAQARELAGCWAAFSPDGDVIAVEDPLSVADKAAGEVGTCTFVALADGEVRFRAPGRAPMFAPDRHIVVTVVGTEVVLWDAETGARIRTLPAAERVALRHGYGAAPSRFPGGEMVFVPQDWSTYAAWHLSSGRHFTVEGSGLRLVPGRDIVVAVDREVVGLDARTGSERYRLRGDDVQIAPAGDKLATTRDAWVFRANESTMRTGSTTVAEADTGAVLFDVPGIAPRFADNGQLMTTQIDGRLHLWDTTTAAPIAQVGNVRVLSRARRGEPGGMGSGEEAAVPATAVARYADVVTPEAVRAGVPFALTVQLRQSPVAGGTSAPVDFAPTRDKDSQPTGAAAVYAVVYPSAAFEVIGARRRAELTVYPDRDGDTVTFDLRARPGAAGTNEINVGFFVGGDLLGQVTTVVSVTAQPGPGARHVGFRPRGIPQDDAAPDVILTVNRARAQGQDTLSYSLEWRAQNWPVIDAGQVVLNTSAGALLADIFTKLGDASRSRSPDDGGHRESRIRKMGENLYYKLFTPHLKKLFKQLPTGSSLLVYSNEPWIPWELVKPWGADLPPGTDEYLCARFDLSRWYYSDGGQLPRARLQIGDIAPVIPTTNLLAVRTEALCLEQLPNRWPPVRLPRPYPVRADEVLSMMAAGRTNLFHFATHGLLRPGDPTVATIELDRGTLSFDDIIGTDLESGLLSATPLVFLNACHSGRQTVSVVGDDGWVQRFLTLGCRAFIGANWLIDDELAAKFAIAVYDGLVAGRPLARAVRLARADVRQLDPGNATWLAYAVYGHPGLTLSAKP